MYEEKEGKWKKKKSLAIIIHEEERLDLWFRLQWIVKKESTHCTTWCDKYEMIVYKGYSTCHELCWVNEIWSQWATHQVHICYASMSCIDVVGVWG